ncbi:MAG TPA: xanthine dehydrogenase family protein molybdopterin-binding subunit [Gaiellaceae bacterium]|nr:xanthine dehydrogenase family protein molybdopterin-binding subunit [Gaiellaceae bacterium]
MTILETERYVGKSVPRLEDDRLLRGSGRFVDDVDVPGQAWVRMVRSQLAHARIAGIDTTAAREAPGVLAVLTAEDVADADVIPLRLDWPGYELEPFLQPILARGRVRYVGEPIALVVADTPYAAEDAAELIEVDLEPLEVVLDAREGIAEGATELRDGRSNEAAVLEKGYGDVDAAFARAAHVVRGDFTIGRHTGVPMETRGLVADYDPGRGRLTIWGATLVTHYHRRVLSKLLGLALNQIEYRPTDSGGSFGVRGDFFPEDYLVAYLAYKLGRPVKWVEDRAEHLVATNHARQQRYEIEAAFDDEGRLLGLRTEIWQDEGAYIRPTGIAVAEITLGILPGPYRLPAYRATLHDVATNKTPIGAYRAPGRYQTAFVRERLLDIAAAQIGIDPVTIRRRNLISPEEVPWEPGLFYAGESFLLDSGDFTGMLEKSLEAAGFDEWQEEAARLRAEGRLVGNGIGYWIDKSGLGVYETAGIDVDPSGKIRVLTGGASTGQGIETVMAQIAADVLRVSPAQIEVIYGDTNLIPDGVGSWSSRSTVIGGSAVQAAAIATVEKARRLAGQFLEVAEDDLEVADGRITVRGSPALGFTFGELAAANDTLTAARLEEEPGLGARRIYVDQHMNYPYGVNLVQVEIDPELGHVEVRRSFCSCECGRAINPMLVAGQAHGGVAQGLGGALLEEFVYDENGHPRATSFMDYLLPTALEVPPIETLLLEDAPTPTNPLGAKGMGETGIIGMGAAIGNAIDDALQRPDTVHALPVTPERMCALLETTVDGAPESANGGKGAQ